MDAFRKGRSPIRALTLQEHDVSAVQMEISDSREILFKPTRIAVSICAIASRWPQ